MKRRNLWASSERKLVKAVPPLGGRTGSLINGPGEAVECSSTSLRKQMILTLVFLQYLGELTLIDADPYLKYLPSVIAAAAFHLAGYTITGQTWVRSTMP